MHRLYVPGLFQEKELFRPGIKDEEKVKMSLKQYIETIDSINKLFWDNKRILIFMLIMAPFVIIGSAMWDYWVVGFYDVREYVILCFFEYCLFWMGLWFGVGLTVRGLAK